MTDHISLTIDLGRRSYDIFIGSHLLNRAADFIPLDLGGRSLFILTDENVFMPHAQAVLQALKGKAARTEIKILPPGERSKSFEQLQDVLNWLLDHGVDRSSVLIAVGGGVVGDLGGFAASIILRGIPFVQVPTTLLSMVDSSVGGKTGINSPQGKNLIGSFYQPVCVIADTEVLKTLPQREMRTGYAEVLKYGLINQPDFFAWLETTGASVLSGEPQALRHAIYTSCRCKADIVSADETEQGARALLNLGHTFGHALEAAAGYDGTLLHGEAVAIGMVMAFRLSAEMGLCPLSDAQRVRAAIAAAGLPVKPNFSVTADYMLQSMHRDKKATGGALTFILARGIGRSEIYKNVPAERVKKFLEEEL